MQETIRKSPDEIRMMQESYQKLINPFMEQANFILAHSIPRYLLTDKEIKAIYPYQTLKSLALIRIGARQTCIAHFGLEFYNKYIQNNDRTRKTSKT